MAIKNVVRRIGLVFVMISFVLMVMAATPTLTGDVSPDSGDTSTTFTFNVTFTDDSNRTADYVKVNLDGTEHDMTESDDNDVNTTDGKYYYFSIDSLSNATHSYNFTAANGTDIAGPTEDRYFTVNAVAASVPGIIDALPDSSLVNSFENVTQNFSVKVDQYANVSWKIDGYEVQNLSVDPGVRSEYSNSSMNAGTYTVNAIAINDNGTSSPKTWTWNVQTANTPAENDVNVSLPGNLNVIFSQVISPGNTQVDSSSENKWGTHNNVFTALGNYYNITTNAGTAPSSNITIELGYDPGDHNETYIKLYHYEGEGGWVDVTSNLDTADKKVSGNVTSLSPFVAGAPPKPTFYDKDPSTPQETNGSDSRTFKVKIDQTSDVTWNLSTGISTNKGQVLANVETNETYQLSSPGVYTITVTATNTSTHESNFTSWNWTVHPRTYSSGNRVWDENKDMSTTYTWSPMSFYAFYYDVDDDVGNEELKITLDGRHNRNIGSGNLVYQTRPEPVTFKYKDWGSYNVIGFMAEKYFAGYTGNTTIQDVTAVSTLNRMQLHKVLKDDKSKFTVRASSTYPLDEGYSVTIKDVGAGREAMISILKDGVEVYTDIKESGETLVYTKKVGSINDLPIIALHIGSVFMGTTENMVVIDGIFQISESYTSVNSNNNYGIMEIKTVSDAGITMKNDNSFTLSQGSTIDIMGEMKFIVANNGSVLRFAPMVKKSGEYEVRGTISNNETDNEWTPLNFEGFYYNLDDDVGTEKMTLKRSEGSRTVSDDQIVYTTTATPVSFKYSSLGTYNVIGFMAEQYFAGYIAGSITDNSISTIGRNQLHKVLIDDDTQRVIYAGSTLTLNEGYVLKIKDVNMGAGSAEVWLSLLKDGTEVDEAVVSAKDYYIYAPPKVGAISDLPIIALRIESIFRGKEATAAFVKGTFQISESYTSVKSGDNFDKMEVTGVSGNSITMTNPNTVSLDTGSSDILMKNIRLKVADSPDIRFYPYILVNGSAFAANQLAINLPSSMMVKDVINISITSGDGTPQDNAEVSFDGEVIGTTNATGKLEYPLTTAGQHNFTATKLGYERAIKSVQIAEYVDNRLNFELPEIIDQSIPVSIKVKVSGTGDAIADANITLDDTSIGKTDSDGILTYAFTSSGTHNLAASKSGFISVQREINVRMPFTEFKAIDINFRPDVVPRGQNVYVWSNITNSGTKEGTLPVALMINNTVVENSNVTLAPGKNGEVNFSYKVELIPGNYTVEILGQKTTMPVKEEPPNLFLIAGIITIIGAIVIFFMTSKNLISIEALKAKLNLAPATSEPIINKMEIDKAINDLKSKFKKP